MVRYQHICHLAYSCYIERASFDRAFDSLSIARAAFARSFDEAMVFAMDTSGAAVYMGSTEEVAARLGITPAGLRRLADIYGEVYEPLQRDTHYNNRRLWTLVAVERLEAARALVQADRARSIKAALLMLQSSMETPQEALALPSKEVSKDPVLLALLEHVQRLESRMEAMQRQLEAPKADDRTAELARMNAYLLGELERRRLEDETARRPGPWWHFWERS